MAGLGGTSTGEIDAPIDEVWATLTAIETIAEWQDGIIGADPIERDGDGQVVLAKITADVKVKELSVVTRFSRQAPTSLIWKVESGDVKKLDGSWTLEDLGGGRTRATYEIEVDPGRMLSMLVRGPVEEKIRQRLVSTRPAELAERVKADRG
ncbi:SRPBCC family protein [Patulibacter sp. NPDC049589]|uniref:type II toxin-antitoxin system RatA family toxin n=1 Tax=Patulibacter sp. NPDC049589 TaxID=3154731 RepID=UPI00342DC8B9